MTREDPLIAIIGGSGIYSIPELDDVQWVQTKTEYGRTSDDICIGSYNGRRIAFLPRHGHSHSIPPHRIPYRANIAALASLGVKRIFATCVCGALKHSLPPGTFIIADQFVDLTHGREEDSTDDRTFVHMPMADPYCETLRHELKNCLAETAVPYEPTGTIVVIQGPRFSTRAECVWFAANNWDVVNMTQYPECYFAREAGLCYAVVASVSDYAPNIRSEWVIGGRNHEKIDEIFWANAYKQRELALRWAETCTLAGCCADLSKPRPYFRTDNEDFTSG